VKRLVALLVLLAACRAPAHEIRVGSKKFTESVVLGEIVTQTLASQGTPVEHRAQLGGTQVLWHALLAGEIDLYPEYTGTIREDILRDASGSDDESLRTALASHGIGMSGVLGFDDSYALGMKDAEAAKWSVTRISDLRRLPRLRLAFSEEFLHRKDGWPTLRERYGLPQTDVKSLDHDLAYRALAAGDVDVIDLYTTDAEIPYYQLKVLEDDLEHFPKYRAVLLYRLDLPSRVPSALPALSALEGRIDTAEMRRLNARVKLDRVPETAVAAAFLGGARQREGRAARIGRRSPSTSRSSSCPSSRRSSSPFPSASPPPGAGGSEARSSARPGSSRRSPRWRSSSS
jgi:osmoprotectant transport system permease protein